MPARIEDYALIGDCETAALVSRDGSIDWLCWPRFDSGACFAALLGDAQNGRWRIAPEGNFRVRRHYREGTLVLETEFETETGVITLIDFMPLRGRNSDLVRLVRGKRGEVRVQMELIIRFDYGRTIPWVTRREDGSTIAIAGPHMLALWSTAPIHGEDLKTISGFAVKEGDSVSFQLTYGLSHLSVPEPVDAEQSLVDTEDWWRKWSSRCTYNGSWSDAVHRSLITLKALTYQPTGGVLAAPTTSLPEASGGSRNWDYRFCWLRDATFTLLALMEAGYYDEARDWRNWLVRTVAGSPNQVQILYGAAGERQFVEWEVPWLCGYQGSTPVRVGNAAAGQLQLDVYGELADVLHQARLGRVPEYEPAVELQRALTEHLEKIWHEADHGIWEFRGKQRHFTHSKVMAWVAFDRMIRSSEQFGLDGPLDRWRAVRHQIHAEVCHRGFDKTLGSFVQSYGSKEVDASLLLIPIVGFLPASDPRVIGTVREIENRLLWNGFVRRYDTSRADDGLPAGEGAFLACTFWLADNYILMGRQEEAKTLLTRLLELRNDVGLLAEEYDPERRCLLGNFPQAFSHVALLNTVLNLGRDGSPLEKRSDTKKKTPQTD
jgi:GH15 family glucan-1,4-alpha-glucosidase